MIRAGYREDLENLRELAAGGKRWIAQYQAEIVEKTGIANLQRRLQQGLRLLHRIDQFAARQSAPVLHSQADAQECRAVHHAGTQRVRRESAVGGRESRSSWNTSCSWNCATRVHGCSRRLRATAGVLAQLDVLLALAELARQRGYCRPTPRRGTGAENPGRSASGAGHPRTAGDVRSQRHPGQRRRRRHSADHRPEHGRQEHLYPPGGVDRLAGPDRQLRARPRGDAGRRRPHLRSCRGQRRTGARAEHFHGGNDRDGADLEQRHGAQPGDSR